MCLLCNKLWKSFKRCDTDIRRRCCVYQWESANLSKDKDNDRYQSLRPSLNEGNRIKAHEVSSVLRAWEASKEPDALNCRHRARNAHRDCVLQIYKPCVHENVGHQPPPCTNQTSIPQLRITSLSCLNQSVRFEAFFLHLCCIQFQLSKSKSSKLLLFIYDM